MSVRLVVQKNACKIAAVRLKKFNEKSSSVFVRCQGPFSGKRFAKPLRAFSASCHSHSLLASTRKSIPPKVPPIFMYDAAPAAGAGEASPERVMQTKEKRP